MESLGTESSWPSKKSQAKPSRIHNHHVSLREKIEELQSRSHGMAHHPKPEQGRGGSEMTKAVAWAVFQHHGEGGVGHGHTHGMGVRRPTRFKIEAMTTQELAHRFVYEDLAFKWDAGSTLFDSFELSSLLKTLNEAAHAAVAGTVQKKHAYEAGEAAAIGVYSRPKSPTHWTTLAASEHRLGDHGIEGEDRRLVIVHEMPPKVRGEPGQVQHAERYHLTGNDLQKHGQQDAKHDSSVFGHWYAPKNVVRRSFDSSNHEKPEKEGTSPHDHHHHHHNPWKSLLHTLHLDAAHHDGHHDQQMWKNLLHALHLDGFRKSHTQVAPHDLVKTQEHKGRSKSQKFEHRVGSHSDEHLERNDLPVLKDVDPPASDNEKQDDHHHHHGHHHHRHHPHFWKFGFKTALTKPFCGPGHLLSDSEGSDSESHQGEGPDSESHRGHKGHKGHKKHHGYKHADLHRSPYGSKKDDHQGDEQSVIEHHHHHHVDGEGEEMEITMQAILKRIARTSLFDKTRRLSIEDGGLKAPRNSLETSVWA